MSGLRLNTDPKKTLPRSIYEDGGTLVQNDGRFWSDLNTDFSSVTSAPMTGYEAFSVKYTAIETLSTDFKKFRFENGDGEVRAKSSSSSYTTTYENITLRGKIGERVRVRSAFVPYVTGYEADGTPTVTTIGDISGTVEVLERWPTAKMYASGDNDNGEGVFSEDRIVWAFEPMYVNFTDASVARTFPISGWFINYGDGSSSSFSAPDASYHPKNEIVQHTAMFSHTYQRANTYYATLYNEASTTATKSAEVLSRGVGIDASTLNTETTARIDVYPLRSINNFYLISGESVSPLYSADGPTPASPVTTYGGTFISGYAPNLTVTFQDSCTPVSFPISSYQWNMGDVFDPVSSNIEVCASNVQTGFGAGWITDKTNHYITYKYRFPGLYKVSLGSEVSADPTYNPAFSYSLSPEICSRYMLVYVEEIYPQAIFGVSDSVSGPFGPSVVFSSTPMTVFFNASSTVAGSFPIDRVVWNFGDGTTQTVLSSVGQPFPQQVTVSHEYTRTILSQPSTFNVEVSAFAFNTDTVDTYSITGIGPLAVSPTSAVSAMDWPVHLIEGSLYNQDDLLLVFEGKNKGTFTYLLSTPEVEN